MSTEFQTSPKTLQPAVTLQHTSGATVEIALYGATVTSFKSSDGTELLFVSEKAVFDGKKAIRGGIPLVFPQFGQPKKAMSSHGFARTSTWNIGESSPEGDNVTATFTLQDSPETKEVWPHAFRLRYVVSLNATSLTTTLHIENAGDAPFDFQTLLHTYLRVPDIDAVQIEGFKGLMYDDKVAGGTHTEERGKVTFAGEMDRVYKHPEEGKSVPDIVVMGEGSDRIVTVAKSAAKSGGGGGDAAVGADCVLWNPWVDKAKALSDMADEEYKVFLCVEPGLVDGWQTLQPGEACRLSQTITASP